MTDLTAYRPIAALVLRIALAAAFLSAVADRFGIWGPPGAPNVAWGTFASFLEYTAAILWFLPPATVSIAGWIATVLEVVLAIGLLAGFQLRCTALVSSLLLASFAIAMSASFGFEPALSYSVWTAAAAGFLLATLDESSPNASSRSQQAPAS